MKTLQKSEVRGLTCFFQFATEELEGNELIMELMILRGFAFLLFLVTSSHSEEKYELQSYSPELLKKAESGDPKAQFLVAKYLRLGKGVSKNEHEAIKWYMQSAKQGHTKSMNSLGGYYLENKVDSPETDAEIAKALPEMSFSIAKKDKKQPHNLEQAVYWFFLAADGGNPRAKRNIGFLYSKGIGLEQSDIDAVKWWKEAALEGEVSAQCNLANAYLNGRGCEKNESKAFELMCMAVNKTPQDEIDEKNIADAQAELGRYYYEGIGTKKNLNDVFKWATKSAQNGSAIGQNNLGNAYYNGYGTEKNISNSIIWYQKSAAQGNDDAMYQLGWLSANGIGLEKSNDKAFSYYKKAADNGNREAQNNLANLYSKGLGVQKNEAEAFRLWLRSSLQTNTFAFANLGLCYEKGTGVKVNISEAFRWYEKGALAGEPSAEYYLGRCYESGNGVDKNLDTAKQLYLKAADQGLKEAKEALRSLE